MASDRGIKLDSVDLQILRILQQNVDVPLEKLADKVGASRTTVWNRIQTLQSAGVITRRVALVDPVKAGLAETFYVTIRTRNHDQQWLDRFSRAITELPEIMEAHRLAGEVDYLLKVLVASTQDYDGFYKRLIAKVELDDVTSSLSMETLKYETALPLNDGESD